MKSITLHLTERLVWQIGLALPFLVSLWIWGPVEALAQLWALIGLLVLHEPLHVAGYTLVGRRTHLTMVRGWLPTVAVYVAQPMPIVSYRVGLLAPAIWMSATCLVGAAFGQFWLVSAGLGGLASTSSDLALAWKTRSVRGQVEDHPTDLGILIPESR